MAECKCCQQDPCCCAEDADNYTATFSGLSDGTKTGSDRINGHTFCLCKGACNFQNVVGVVFSGDTDIINFPMKLTFACDEDPQVVRLTIYGEGVTDPDTAPVYFFSVLAVYELARDDWVCGAANTLDRISSEPDLTGWAATLTLTPNGGHDVCCECDDCPCTVYSETDPNDPSKLVQRAWEVTFAGITDAGDCPECTNINNTFCLTTFSEFGKCEWMHGAIGGVPLHNWPPLELINKRFYHTCYGCEWRTCYDTGIVPCGWDAYGFLALLKTGCDEYAEVSFFPDETSLVLPPTNDQTYHQCVFRVPPCHYYLRFGARGSVVDIDPPDSPSNEDGMQYWPIYTIPVDDFDPVGANILTRLDHEPLGQDVFGTDTCLAYQCDGWPATVTITPVDSCADCEGVPPPEPACSCLPKTDYAPRAVISGIVDGSCTDCECLPELALCFTPTGSASECTWRADISFPASDAFACTSDAAYAILTTGPTVVTIVIYDSGDVEIARFSEDISGFTCDDAAFSLPYDSQSDTCDWSAATCTLDMHSSANCGTCVCAAAAWTVQFTYDGDTYIFCVSVGSCSGTSDSTAVTGGGGDQIYIVIELGELPALFARVLVYYDSGTPVLIGIYNYLSAMSGFSCSSPNTLNLSAGNAGECGSDIDEVGYTENLGATASLGPVECGGTETYTTPGTYYLCTETGVTYTIEGWGSGGSGKSGTTGNRNAGGGGGAYAKKTWVSDGSRLTIVVPAGGASALNADGNDGAAATVDGASTLMKAAGGKKGVETTGGAGGLVADCIGDVGSIYAGGTGGSGAADDIGGGGGSSAGPSSAGNNATGTDGETGGAAVTGGGAGGNGGVGGAGTAGSAPGGGGGGGDNDVGGASGAGANGKVKISC